MERQIKSKAKYRLPDKVWGYPRNHNGNSAKKRKKLGGWTSSAPYDRNAHVLVVDGGTGHRRFYHYAEARKILGIS